MEQIFQLLINNGVGVFFGYLLYTMATGAIKENKQAIEKLTSAITNLCEILKEKN